MIEKEIINLLDKTLSKTLDVIEPIKLSENDRHEVESLYKQLGKALDRSLGTNISPKGFVGNI
ncbi:MULTISPECIES: hypothetical protein [Pectobacterium]|uniref:Uncharacterized protein n=1 Tax=Pectobacterium aquaticum TaxID=2204145 RepID=A0AA93DKS4_9GAMM|nr:MULTISPECIES: hypothetical protein [Pectobacterium]KHS99954.1 hypothetical protein RC88_01445 [Pectobacterium parvum]MBN3238331.1 hypothetical protein [Pectobacterium versatile]QLL92867.1 hypothetical protein HER17_07960 [Pectobacterium carotovorum]RRO14574.1 hypothetical protein DMB84_017355 [Pectobacterium aquaticum]TAI86942.1 hypothetical protein EG330_06075 [Pectobacterium versatile]